MVEIQLMDIVIKPARTIKENKMCLKIRRKVFIEEQQIDEKIELDDDRVKAFNFIALYNDRYVGTARYRITDSGIKLERFAILKPYRKLGIGKSLVKYLKKSLINESKVYLHAQKQVVDFYKKLGFKKTGKIFYEAGVPHYKLIRL